MHPPVSACRALSYLHPRCRLAWAGTHPAHPGDINPGNFGIVQLMPRRHIGGITSQYLLNEVWGIQTKVVDEYGTIDTVRVDQGPIFSKDGELAPDWDKNEFYPVLVAVLDDSHVYPDGVQMRRIDDVFSGKFIEAAAEWLRPIAERDAEQKRAHDTNFDDQVSMMAHAFREDLAADLDAQGIRFGAVTKDEKVAAIEESLAKGQFR